MLNGLLHDVFVLGQKRKYDRDLLRLLLDGHILVTCGMVEILSYVGLRAHAAWGLAAAALGSASLLIYCLMIFPFLKSVATLLINGALLAMVAAAWTAR